MKGDINNIEWKYIKTKNNIQERSQHGMIYYNNKIYIICGYNHTDRFLNDIHYLELKKDEYIWKKSNVRNIPKMSAFTCHLYNNNALIFGGWVNRRVTNDLYSFDILDEKINKINIDYNNITLKERKNHASCIYDNKLFIFGGCDAGNMNINDNNIYYINLLNDPPSLYYIQTHLQCLRCHSMLLNSDEYYKDTSINKKG